MVIQLSKLIEIQGFIRAKIVFHGFRRYCKLPQISVKWPLVIFEIQIVLACFKIVALNSL